ncbi:hypothetical protein LBMAG18_03230 [Alphaproteobacteria bacterium]|nr:hypothetical protein LBMAG18_03230 [Alphaproteobacteria bacterium]
MKRSLLFKKKAQDLGLLIIEVLIFIVKRLAKIAFAKRTILFVTNEKIRSVNLGVIPQIAIVLVIAWMINIFNQSFRYNEILEDKSREISRLKSINSYFEDEFDNVNEKLKKINEYVITITGSKHNVKEVRDNDSSSKIPKNIDQNQLSKRDKLIINSIADSKDQMNDFRFLTKDRIKKIENAISLTGLTIKKSKSVAQKILNKADFKETSLNNSSQSYSAQGGPDESNSSSIDNALTGSKYKMDEEISLMEFTSEIDYLMVLEKLAKAMPFGRPMKNYYVSSGFGMRVDPLTHRYNHHSGLDFVGVANEKIISPSAGKVILAGKFSDYGNAVVIDHGYGISTRYGHLSAIKVKEGDIVRQGEVIAFQGNTGRSTGAHLHYEVRYKNIPLNPRKFLEAGEILNNEKTKYVNS